MDSYAHLEREFNLHRRLNKIFGEVIPCVHLNRFGRVYFWDKSIGYTHNNTSIKKMVSHGDLLLLNTVRKNIIDIDNSRKLMYDVIESITRVRMNTPLALVSPLIVASLLTNFFSEIPITKEGELTYNIFYIEGDIPCVTQHGVMNLSVYSSFDECLQDLADKLQTAYDEDETFKILYTSLFFSLTLYRVYFILVHLLKKGVNICEENMEMDFNGRFSNSNSSRSFLSKEEFGHTLSTRPRRV